MVNNDKMMIHQFMEEEVATPLTKRGIYRF
jgi:hypothetical protein